MSWKEKTIKEHFINEMQQRRSSERECMLIDWESNSFILLRNVDETIDFLLNASMEEIGWAIEIVEDMARVFPKNKAQICLNIFKKKLIEFPGVQDVCEVDYAKEMEIAQEIIETRV